MPDRMPHLASSPLLEFFAQDNGLALTAIFIVIGKRVNHDLDAPIIAHTVQLCPRRAGRLLVSRQ